ncbi:MAG: mandelate racemase/muconate lactonizing enzyme family protein [Acidobacteria bacterium]|nr:mandelate racemase/muconate lactonizing enzyme family protein [Acidobacteriota bacterium]
MRIENISAFPVRIPRDTAAARGLAGSPTAVAPVENGGDGRYRWSTAYPVLYPVDFETALIRIDLSNGLTGWGEAQAPLVPEVACTLIDLLLAPVLRGQNFNGTPAEISAFCELLYSTMRVRGQTGGYQLDAMAGLDLALWDLAGKMANQPVSQLLGGTSTRVPAYVSGVAGSTDEERLAFIDLYVHRGFRLFKVYLEESWPELDRRVRLYQSAFPQVRFAVDALWHLPSGAGLDLDLEWMECPFLPEDHEEHHRWTRRARAPLALGESYRTRHELRPFLPFTKVLQPDLGRCGITETVAIGKIAKRLVPHLSIALAPQILAAVHVAAALPNSRLCEYNPRVLETANQYLSEPIELDGPNYVVPQRPGLGVAFNLAGLAGSWIGSR